MVDFMAEISLEEISKNPYVQSLLEEIRMLRYHLYFAETYHQLSTPGDERLDIGGHISNSENETLPLVIKGIAIKPGVFHGEGSPAPVIWEKDVIEKYWKTFENKKITLDHFDRNARTHIGNITKVWYEEVSGEVWFEGEIFDRDMANKIEGKVVDGISIHAEPIKLVDSEEPGLQRLIEFNGDDISVVASPACSDCRIKECWYKKPNIEKGERMGMINEKKKYPYSYPEEPGCTCPCHKKHRYEYPPKVKEYEKPYPYPKPKAKQCDECDRKKKEDEEKIEEAAIELAAIDNKLPVEGVRKCFKEHGGKPDEIKACIDALKAKEGGEATMAEKIENTEPKIDNPEVAPPAPENEEVAKLKLDKETLEKDKESLISGLEEGRKTNESLAKSLEEVKSAVENLKIQLEGMNAEKEKLSKEFVDYKEAKENERILVLKKEIIERKYGKFDESKLSELDNIDSAKLEGILEGLKMMPRVEKDFGKGFATMKMEAELSEKKRKDNARKFGVEI